MAITKASESPYRDIDVIPTGFSKLDKLIGIGGIPHRKLTEITGKTSVGKSTLSYLIIAQAQKQGKDCLYADTEFSWDEAYGTSLGVDITKLDLSQEEYAEQTLQEIEEWARQHTNSLIVLDSIGGLLSRDEAEKKAGEKVIGGQARLVAAFSRKIVPILAHNNVALIVLNHLFLDIMTGTLNPSGGWKLAYHKSLEIRLSKSKNVIRQGEKMIGRQITAKIMKTKVSKTQDHETSLNLIFGEGFSQEADILEEALDKGVITKKGAMFFFGDEKFFGQNKLRDALKDASFAAKIKALL